MVLIAILAYFNPTALGFENAIPVLAVFAVGAQLLPLLQQIYSSWTSIEGPGLFS